MKIISNTSFSITESLWTWDRPMHGILFASMVKKNCRTKEDNEEMNDAYTRIT